VKIGETPETLLIQAQCAHAGAVLRYHARHLHSSLLTHNPPQEHKVASYAVGDDYEQIILSGATIDLYNLHAIRAPTH